MYSYGQRCIKRQMLSLTANISKPDLVGELHERNVSFRMDEKKDSLMQKLESELSGIHHVPALLFGSSELDLSTLGLDTYEVLPVEPLHTIAGHTKNLYVEIPFHLGKEERKIFEKAAAASFGGKEVKRGCDYRKSLVDLVLFLEGKINTEIYSLLAQLSEIQEVMYSDEKDRSQNQILRFYNLTFQHASLMHNLFSGNCKSLTSRKLFGQYYHALVSHAPTQLRIMALTSANTENEERAFNFLKVVSTHASNHHPENVLLNAFLRLQVRADWENHLGKKMNKNNKNSISVHSKFTHSNRKETFYPFSYLKRFPRQWQSHLERICDFISIPGVWEETDQGILFHDLRPIEHHPSHFKSSTLQLERK